MRPLSDLAVLLLALVAAVVVGRYVLALLHRFLPWILVAIVAVVLLCRCDGSTF